MKCNHEWVKDEKKQTVFCRKCFLARQMDERDILPYRIKTNIGEIETKIIYSYYCEKCQCEHQLKGLIGKKHFFPALQKGTSVWITTRLNTENVK